MVSSSFIAGALTGVAASFIAVRLWRSAELLQRRVRYVSAVAALVAAVALAAGIIYLAAGAPRTRVDQPTANPATADGAPAKSMQVEVAGLEARLARDGGSDADWTLLAQSYEFLGRPEDAGRARTHLVSTTVTPVGEMSAAALSATAAATERVSAGATAAPGTASGTSASAAELDRRVSVNPSDAASWLALAQLRGTQRDYAGARLAYVRVIDLKAMSAQSWADYADLLGTLNGGSLKGEAAQAIDSALKLDARNAKALWLEATLAHERHDYADARRWWQRLRAVIPADSPDAAVVDGNLAEAAALASAAPGAAPAASAAPPAGSAAEISGTVSLAGRFAARVQPDATLFVYAKAADSAGPPLAVWRTTASEWPVRFRLDDSMAMLPSRRLSQFDKVIVEARISRSGQATPASGDLYVTSDVVRPLAGQKLTLVIDREIG